MTKTIRLFVVLLTLAAAGVAQAVELKTLEQRFSYAAGYTFAKQMASQPITLDRAVVIAAIEDILDEKDPQMSMEEMADTLAEARQYIAKLAEERMNQKLEEGNKFLAENKKKQGVTELPSGLQYIVIHPGKGESPKTDADVSVHYRGTFLDGREFDSSTRHGSKPVTFNLGKVIPGFREAISKMKPGAKWRIFVPSDLAYGPQGAPPAIGPNETLIFEIELISIGAPEKKDAGAAAEKKDAG